jgi:glutamyl-tRNA synthetase
MSRAELIEKFSLDGVNKASAIFNFNEKEMRDWTDPKALWMNAEYIRAMPLGELVPLVAHQLKQFDLWKDEYEAGSREIFARTIDLLRARYRTTQDFATLGRPYFSDDFEYEPDAMKKNMKDERLKDLLPGLAERLAEIPDFTHDAAELALRAYAEAQGVKAGLLINAARTALTGQAVGPSMFDIMIVLGRDRTVARLRRAASLLNV